MWIIVLGVNQLWLSAAIAICAQAVGMWRVRNISVLANTLVLSLPVFLSMVLVHVPFGQGGWQVALALTLRFTALMSVFLVAATAMTVPDLVKALYRWPRLAYVVGSAVQMLPQGREALASVRDANKLRGRNTRGPVRSLKYIGLPLIIRLLNAGASRAIPLEVAGLDRKGSRTLLVDVRERRVEKLLRWLFPLLAIGVVWWL
ncbi:energy-coupling factor transporter transmembrane protein EcfT [Corynebacterium callunae]|uniref:energy-coupling factor transporter transmembrane component T family protein n=1 Tax=Corynebacterium callunae TaxID=1721 RepID=UPI003981E9AC